MILDYTSKGELEEPCSKFSLQLKMGVGTVGLEIQGGSSPNS
jgi:hypothetical protein